MKQFGTVFKFELLGYLKNKIFVGLTVLLVAAIIVAMFIPNIIGYFSNGEDNGKEKASPVMLIYAENSEFADSAVQYFANVFPTYEVKSTTDNLDSIKSAITTGEASCAFVIDCTGSSYTYYVDVYSMTDNNANIAKSALIETYKATAMLQNGLSVEQVESIMNVTVESKVETLGKDQTRNFGYTYIMIFALYIVILLYGQMVATNVATEKSSRAMEVIVTSARPNSMLFGKVFASCTAGLAQLLAVFGAAIICYNINKEQLANPIIASIMDIPLELLIYMLVFFVLGFLVYAFMFAAIGSTATKLEDINTSTMPVMFVFIFAFMVVMTAMMDGNVNSTVMVVCSYIPFISPMAMFTRIAMSNVALYEILISIGVLAASTVGVGVLSAKIYRMGVLLYGAPLNFINIIKMAFKKS